MTDRHKRRPISFRPADDDYAWLENHAKETGKPVRRILAESLSGYRAKQEAVQRHADHEPGVICRPTGAGLCEAAPQAPTGCTCTKWRLWELPCPAQPTRDDGLCDTCRTRQCKMRITDEGEAFHVGG